MSRSWRAAVVLIFAAALAGCSAGGVRETRGGAQQSTTPQVFSGRTASEQRIGDENHPRILAEYGGEVPDAAIRSYVSDIGRRISSNTEQPNAKWTFTVLDSPVINAFALPGGYVYVTRGLLALADDEAELAGVLGHEMGHVTARHGTERQNRSQRATVGVLGAAILGAVLGGERGAQLGLEIGQTVAAGSLASYSRTQEFEADTLGVSYIARTGYDPIAQAEFLESMSDKSSVDATLQGGTYNPNRVDFLASHPATADRVRQAIAAAGRNASGGTARNEDRYLNMIDGMVYGDSPKQGFVRGNSFQHPVLRFMFSVPEGYRITNQPTQIIAAGRDSSVLIMDAASDPGGSLTSYLRDLWYPQIRERNPVGDIADIRPRRIDGLDAATMTIPVQQDTGVAVGDLTVIRANGRLYRFTALSPQTARASRQALDRSVQSFDSLTEAQAARLKPYRVRVTTVRAEDTVNSLAQRMSPGPLRLERFLALNSLDANSRLTPGQRVKLVSE
ncbi:MAG: M48 family metalloprotease [Pseudomonadota bacterium]